MTSIRRITRITQPLRRTFSSTSSPSYQHVLYFGNLLGYQSIDRLAKFSRSWLDSAGVSGDVDRGLRYECMSSGGVGHVLVGYTLLDTRLDGRSPRQTSEQVSLHGAVEPEEEVDGEVIHLDTEDAKSSTSSQPSKVFALGRNTHAQLGLGFTSQEATRGMVTGEFAGEGGVSMLAAGNGFSFIVTSSNEGGKVFAFGNDTLGQLGSNSLEGGRTGEDAYDVSIRSGREPQLKLLPLPREVPVGGEGEEGWEVKSISAGLDHSLVLVEKVVNGRRVQRVLSTGLNTDGQLGLTEKDKEECVPIEPLIERGFTEVPITLSPKLVESDGEAGAEIVQVVCGADTSYALTAGGDLWVWGNSEYGQSFAGIHDRIVAPLFVPNPLPDAYRDHSISFDPLHPPKLQKLVAGGSFAAILDTQGRVWVVGYGPRGQPVSESKAQWSSLSLVEFPPDMVVETLFSGLEYFIATARSPSSLPQVFIWGIPPRAVSTEPIVTPTPVPFSIPKTPRQKWLDDNPRLKQKQREEAIDLSKVKIQAAACTREHLLLIVDDGVGGDFWAECDHPPRDKGTDVTL
ncbi:hypothetical protein PHSY_006748 [Pseudozyma hubeiensis SY62]|uniref:Uncharacterized protein n=1 Tax=Pseudozyma hubeiensis (strain SY62) TaxID=1305764 RepID=R9PCQ8_PSEHS|nr:hypothetical protein PHSY_006748 [Pseudozyma hubeiensis SY62]GAC99149.1 hypothetical protein PHSY_006748 [Pseudozyma hubeiensis SY62]